MLLFREIFHQTLATTPVNFNELSMGFGYGWVSPTLESLSHPDSVIPLTTEQRSWIASLQEIGRTIGPIISIFLLDVIGRKKVLITSGTIFFVQWLIIIFTKSVWALYLVRLLFGVAIGLNDVTSSIYFGENSSPSIRGILSSVTASFFYFGVLLEFIFNNYFSYYTVAIINVVLSGIGLVTAMLLTEPAQFLIMRGKVEKAKKNFLWLRGNRDTPDVQQEFTEMKDNICREQLRKKSIVQLLTTDRFIYKITIIVLLQYTLTMSTGFSAVNAFATVSFSNSQLLSKQEFTMLLGLVQLIAVSSSSLFIEKFPRKTIMRTFYGLAALVHLCSATLFYIQQYVCEIPNFSLYIFVTITAYSAVFAIGILPSFCLLRGELFPQSIKVVGGCISIIGNSLMGIFINRVYLVVAETYGIYLNYLFFSFCSFVTVLFVHFVLPETRGKTLVEIQKSIDEKSVAKCADEKNLENF